MDEEVWRGCDDPEAMLGFLGRRLTTRKRRLFGCACLRHVWQSLPDAASRAAVEVAERYADGCADDWERETARRAHRRPSPGERAVPGSDADQAVREITAHPKGFREVYVWQPCARLAGGTGFICAILRDLFGPLPFRPVALPASLRTWSDGTVAKLARGVYDDRELPGGTLERMRLGVLADALEEAGGADPDVLGHLRGPGPHVRGCWAVDLILAKQ